MKPDDSTGVQSRVIHVRALPDDVSQEEVINLCLPFKKYGQPKEYLLLKVIKNYLFINILIIVKNYFIRISNENLNWVSHIK